MKCFWVYVDMDFSFSLVCGTLAQSLSALFSYILYKGGGLGLTVRVRYSSGMTLKFGVGISLDNMWKWKANTGKKKGKLIMLKAT
jgi:hypothetical protein